MSECDPQKLERLIHAALAVRERAYARSSRFQVGAALITADGEIVVGCNVNPEAFRSSDLPPVG